MIRKLKVKFVTLATAALFILLAVIVVGMNLINYGSIVRESDRVLSVLSQDRSEFPAPGEGPGNRLPHNMSPETPYESRYFSVYFDTSLEVTRTETSRITSVDAEAAIEYAQTALKSVDMQGLVVDTQGFVGEFRYLLQSTSDGYRITFLDCGRRLDSFYNFLLISSGMALAGLAVFSLIVFIFSGRVIKPISESYKKQKRFITDAGHEIKTPLTIIQANADLLEMELGENESLDDIQQQLKRLRSLTGDLVMLARMEEAEDKDNIIKIDFPFSDAVAEAAQPFRALAVQQGKELICDIEPMLTINGNDKAVRRLISVLMDNALKYSPSGSAVSLDLTKRGKTICLTVTNSTENELDPESLNRVFDRFYRADASRSSETGGHGIGLSVAQAIVTAHGGTIRASTPDAHSFQISVTLPHIKNISRPESGQGDF